MTAQVPIFFDCIAHTCIFDTSEEGVDISRENRTLESLLDDPSKETSGSSKQLKNITGYSDADWAGDPVTRKSFSCSLCYLDDFFFACE